MQDRKLPWIDRMLRPLVRRPALYYAALIVLGVSTVSCSVWPFVDGRDALAPLVMVAAASVDLLIVIHGARRRYLAWLDLMVRVYVRPVHPIRRGKR